MALGTLHLSRCATMVTMTDGIAWLAAPQSIAFGGYSVTLARGLGAEELVSRLTATVLGPQRTARNLGDLTGTQLGEVLEDAYGRSVFDTIGLRYSESEEFSFVVKYGAWQAEFGNVAPVARGGVHLFTLEYEEENGKPVPPTFAYFHDVRPMCAFNLHLDSSWGYDGVAGDPEVASSMEEMLSVAGLPDETLPRRDVHRTALEAIQRRFGLSLSRKRILDESLPAAVLETI